MLIKVLCVLSMLNKLPPGVCWRGGGGGGGGGATGLLNKGGGATGFLWNFHRYRLVIIIFHKSATQRLVHTCQPKKIFCRTKSHILQDLSRFYRTPSVFSKHTSIIIGLNTSNLCLHIKFYIKTQDTNFLQDIWQNLQDSRIFKAKKQGQFCKNQDSWQLCLWFNFGSLNSHEVLS